MAGSKSKSKKLLVASGLITLVLAFSTVYLVHYYGETRPTVAQPDAGRTHSVTIHSRTVYLTSGEYALAFATHAITIVAIGVVVGLLLRSFRRDLPPKAES
jgi:hypothetical protein